MRQCSSTQDSVSVCYTTSLVETLNYLFESQMSSVRKYPESIVVSELKHRKMMGFIQFGLLVLQYEAPPIYLKLSYWSTDANSPVKTDLMQTFANSLASKCYLF